MPTGFPSVTEKKEKSKEPKGLGLVMKLADGATGERAK